MRFREFVTESSTPSPDELLGLVNFLAGRAEDEGAQKQISRGAFISLAQSLNINVTEDNIEEIVGQPPLSSVLEPMTPDAQEIIFKGEGDPIDPVAMPVNRAQDIVANAAKSAMNKSRGV